jgi:hypothetical protein
MTYKPALEADARLAAKNALKIRAALAQSFDARWVYDNYLKTNPIKSGNLAQDRARARAWVMLNVMVNLEPLKEVMMRVWAEGYVTGEAFADEQLRFARERNKATDTEVDWANWRPGDRAAALLLRPPDAFKKLLASQGITFKEFSDTTVRDIGNAVGEAIELGLTAERSAKRIKDHVASASRALSIAITEQNRAISFATVNRYREAGLEKMEWEVSSPCDKCAQNANQVVAIGGTFNSGATQPPQHPHCRCVLLPVLPDFEDPAYTGGGVITPEAPTVVQRNTFTANSAVLVPGQWQKMTSERWIERRQQERVNNGFAPYTDNQLKILEDQANDARAMWENGPHVVRWDKSSTKPSEEQVQGFIKNFEEALTKLPEWRRFDENGIERGYAAVISAEAGGNTLAYTYLGNNTIWFSNTTVMKSLDAPAMVQGATRSGYKMPAEHTNNANLYTIAHELGHTIDSNANNTIRGRFTGPLKRKFPDLWSGYSRKDADEAYAEVFAQWLLGEHNAITNAFEKKFGWNLSAKEYREQIEVQWKPNLRNQNIGG